MTNTILIDAIETMPKKHLVGFCSILNGQPSSQLYNQLWFNFINRVKETPALSGRELYGVCTNLQYNSYFEYWTAIEVAPEEILPDDLIPLSLEAGTYGSRLEKPENNLPMIYSQLTQSWEAPEDYILNWKLPFFEYYRPNWTSRSVIKICIPLHFSFNSIYKNLCALNAE